MALDEQLQARLEELIRKGEAALATHKPNPPTAFGFPTLASDAYAEWRSQSAALLTSLLGKSHVYVKEFEQATEKAGYTRSVRSGMGVLRAVLDDLRAGFLVDLVNLPRRRCSPTSWGWLSISSSRDTRTLLRH